MSLPNEPQPNGDPKKPSLPSNVPDMSLPEKAQRDAAPTKPKHADALSAASPKWKRGDRVLAPWEPMFLYVGTIVNLAGDQALIEFGDGDAGWVLLREMRPLNLKPGQKILCRRKMGLTFYPATIERIDGEKIVVAFEDGHPDEPTTLAALRIVAEQGNRGAQPVAVQSNRAFLQHLCEGFRVWAIWGGSALFAGTVSEIGEGRALIQFDDGDHSWVSFDQFIPLEVLVGTPVMARRRMATGYSPGLITDCEGQRVQVRYEDGGEEWTPLAAVAIPLQAPPPPNNDGAPFSQAPPIDNRIEPSPQTTRRWKVGDTVWAPWEPAWLYPGVIAKITDDADNKGQALIEYADDGRGWVYLSELFPFTLQVGQRILCRRKKGAFFFLVEVLQVNGEQVQVRYEDNHDTEWTIVAALRMQNDRPGLGAEMLDFGRGLASPKNLNAGDRVWAPWNANMLFAGTVDRMQGLQAHIHYDDGCEGWVNRDQLLKLDLPVGLPLLCRKKMGGEYQPAIVVRSEGERIEVRYENGDTEWTKPVAFAFQTNPAGLDATPTYIAEKPSIWATIYKWGFFTLAAIVGILLVLAWLRQL